MKILVIGSGGREHAICWKLNQSEKLTALYAAPGNPGISKFGECVDISVEAVDDLVSFAKKNKIDFTIVGPELPLTLGIVDAFQKAGLKIFGPVKEAAALEGSKSFAKAVMKAAGVPTADYAEFEDLGSLQSYVEKQGAPLVLKADGLAAGKGVFVCLEKMEAEAAARTLFQEFEADKVVVEEYLEGIEASYIVATDGERIVPLASSHDYKRIFDNDQGLNTGGMGTVSPTPRITPEQEAWVLENIMQPVVREMKAMAYSYQGFLYAGLMINPEGEIKVLEFNARLGDPETQVILRRMESDLLEVLLALHDKTELPSLKWNASSAVCVVQAAENYPGTPVKGDEITGIEEAEGNTDTVVFHAGTKLSDGKLLTNGGRVLNITSTGNSLEEAIQNTYTAVDLVKFRGQQFRGDIGK